MAALKYIFNIFILIFRLFYYGGKIIYYFFTEKLPQYVKEKTKPIFGNNTGTN